MTTTADRPAPPPLVTGRDRPGPPLAHLTPNWYAAVMGTGIVAVAAASLPEQFPGLRAAATVIWALAAALLVAVTTATIAHWRWHPQAARAHARDPIMVMFYGAPPMALLTVGAGLLLLGRQVTGLRLAVDVDWALWLTGTALGLVTAAAVPYLMFTRHRLRPGTAFGGWLMPVVPPLVSASTGALLLPHVADAQARLALLLACYAMFGLSVLASLIVITLIWGRLASHGVGPARLVPTLWLILGPLGQSVTAANLLGLAARHALPDPYASALRVLGVLYGVPVWGFAVLWTLIAAAITLRTARRHLPFSLTWWSFTFPVGTCVTATTTLAAQTGSSVLRVAAAVWYAGLVLAWLTVAIRTAHGTARGTLFLPQPALAAD